MSDPNNVPLPQQPEANGTPTPNPVPQYGAPAPAQPAYGQPAYGQPAPTANSYGQAVPTYGQPAPDANTYGQSAPAYGTPAPRWQSLRPGSAVLRPIRRAHCHCAAG